MPLPALNSEAALREGQVDAAYMGLTALNAAQAQGGLKVLATDVDFVGPYNGGGFHLTEKFIKENPTTTKTLVAGVAKANDYIATHTRDEVVDVINKYHDEKGHPEIAETLVNWAGTNGVADDGRRHPGLRRDHLALVARGRGRGRRRRDLARGRLHQRVQPVRRGGSK